MGSFKLEKGGSAKEQMVSAGAILAVLGIVIYFLFYPVIGIVLISLGIILLIIGLVAKG